MASMKLERDPATPTLRETWRAVCWEVEAEAVETAWLVRAGSRPTREEAIQRVVGALATSREKVTLAATLQAATRLEMPLQDVWIGTSPTGQRACRQAWRCDVVASWQGMRGNADGGLLNEK